MSELFENDKVVELVGGVYDGSLIPISLLARIIGRPDLADGKVALSLPGGSTYAVRDQIITEIVVCPVPEGEKAAVIAETREAGEELREFYGPDFEQWYCIGTILGEDLIPSHYHEYHEEI